MKRHQPSQINDNEINELEDDKEINKIKIQDNVSLTKTSLPANFGRIWSKIEKQPKPAAWHFLVLTHATLISWKQKVYYTELLGNTCLRSVMNTLKDPSEPHSCKLMERKTHHTKGHYPQNYFNRGFR